jgi:hypothetical protein
VGEKTKYEVRRKRGSAWDTLKVFDKEDDAKKFADNIFADRKVTGVNVVRDWTRADGMHIEKIVHELSRAAEEKPVQVQAIEEVNVCTTAMDVYGLESRLAIARLMKQYLDDQEMTASEILHSFRDGKRLLDKDTLISGAVAIVSGLQAKAGAGTALDRKKLIYDLLDDVSRRARNGESLALPELKQAPLVEALAKIDNSIAKDDERLFARRLMLTRTLSNARGFLGKLELLMGFISDDLPEDACALLDEFLADILHNTNVVQEILGIQPNLAGALVSLLDMSAGKWTKAEQQPDSLAGRLNKTFAGPHYQTSKAILLDWVKRQLKGTGPLNRRDPAGENDAFMTVFKRLSADEEWPGGPAMTEALTLRYSKRIPEGGATGRRKAIKGMVELCDQPTLKISYLLALVGSDLGTELRADIVALIKEMVTAKDSVQTFFGRNEGIVDKLRRVTKLYVRAGDVALDAAEKSEVRERLDDLLARYVVDSKIVESLDDPTKSLRIRATRLVQFCNSGALAPGRALKLAQQRVIEQLRQPNFEKAFVEGLPDEKSKATAITDFFVLLKKAGLA